MDYFKLLLQCGLTKKEAAVYIALLEHGELTLSKIHQHTHINRPALYELLPHMQEKGLVSTVHNKKRTTYVAESVEKLIQLQKQTQAETITGLENMHAAYDSTKREQPLIKYFEGKKGVAFVFDDVGVTVPKGGSFYRYTARTGPKHESYKMSSYNTIRETKAIERYAITSEAKAADKKPKLNRHVRAIPKDFDLFDDNVSLLIYGDKTAYIDYENETSVIIESPKIAHFQEKLFKLLWKKLK